jgi:molecular chaperone GrpE (heat shock protein)
MSDSKPSLPLWPFIVVDAISLSLAASVLRFGHRPLTDVQAILIILSGALGSWSFLTPFLRRSREEHAISQVKLITDANTQIQKMDELAQHIESATNHWLDLQRLTGQSVASAGQIAEKMAFETKAFADSMKKATDLERNHLRLEVDKLRRSETDRVQVLVHMLDHVFALYQAARHSKNAGLIEQISQFQNACRDAARRVGLVQTVAAPGEGFDAKIHQLPPDTQATESALVSDTMVAGYTYQGQTLRRPVVTLQETTPATAALPVS